MRNIFSLQIETKISLAIVIIMAIIFVVAVFKSLDKFEEFNYGKGTEIERAEEN
jgi:hypothetical protein